MFKVAAAYPRVRELLATRGWEFQGQDDEMDSFRNKKTGRRLYAEDISEEFPVTFIMGELSLVEFGDIARILTPGLKLLEVESSWEGEPTTVIVAMTEEQVRAMFGRRTKMRQLSTRQVALGV